MMEDVFAFAKDAVDVVAATAAGIFAGFWTMDKKHRILLAFGAFVGIMFLIAAIRTLLG